MQTLSKCVNFTNKFTNGKNKRRKINVFSPFSQCSIPVRVTRNQSTIGGLIFIYFPRESMEAEVNDVSVTRQSRAPARPQARIPVRVTKIKNL